jgi:methionyl-tRNA formyltransferase
MRSVVFAYSDVGYVCLELLLELGADIAAVFTHADDPNERIWFRSVRNLAEHRGIPVFTTEQFDAAAIDRLRGWAPDFLFSFYYRRMLPTAVLETARRGAFNLHGSLLPRYRGRCPVNWVLINDERETGVTLHHMVAKPDAGDIVAQRRVPISDDDTAYTLYGKQTAAAIELMRDIYPRLCDGTAARIVQDTSQATYFGGRRPADGVIDWRRSARQIYNLVRAVTHPYPGAFTHWRGQPLMVWRAAVSDTPRADRSPGTVLQIDNGLVVQTGSGALRALRVQSSDDDECDAAGWARQHGVSVGDTLTERNR